MDGALGSFIEELKQNGLYNSSLIVIYGDHGSFTDISEQMGTTTNEALESIRSSRVPLILLSPKLNSALKGTVSTPGSHLDLYPTLTNLLGIESPQTVLGQDLLNTKTPVVTRRDPYSQIITTILTSDIAYVGADSGIFEEGSCFKMSSAKKLSIGNCKKIYDEQFDTIKVSDLIIKGNLIQNI